MEIPFSFGESKTWTVFLGLYTIIYIYIYICVCVCVYVCVCIHIYTYFYINIYYSDIGIMVRVFANGLGSIPG